MPNSDVSKVSYDSSDTRVVVLKGAVAARLLNIPDRSFAIEVTLDLVKGAEFFDKKPPIHFHVQEEYIEAIHGKLGLELNGKETVLTAEDGRFAIKPYVHHRSYPIERALQDNDNTVVKFLLSGAKTDSTFELNPVFFENWYRYQDEVVVNGAPIDLFQLFCVSASNLSKLVRWWLTIADL
jgi:hypothetical protein